MQRIKKIENLKYEELLLCVSNLVKRLNYSNVLMNANSVTADLKTPLSSAKFQFLVIEDRLSGNIEWDAILKIIKDSQVSFNSSSLYIVSQFNISNGFKETLKSKTSNTDFFYIDRDELIDLLDQNYSDYWKHNDPNLIDYEKHFCHVSQKETDLKKLKIFNDKYQKQGLFIKQRKIKNKRD